MANATVQGSVPRRPWLTVLDRVVLRVAFGAALAFAIALVMDWQYAFLAPLVAASLLLAMPANPSLVQGLVIPLSAAVFCNGALVVAYLCLGSPHVLLLLTGLTLCCTFYAHRRGAPHLVMLIAQVSVAVVAIFAMTSVELAREFSDFFLKGCVAATAAVWISHALIPTPPPPRPAGAAPPAGLPPAWAARIAFCDTLIVMPLVAKFMIASDTDNTVYVTTCLILLGQLEPTGQKEDARNRFYGQFLGGLLAILSQQFVLVADSLTQFLLTVFVAVLWLARRVVRAGPAAGLYVQALSAYILVLGLGVAQGGSEEYYGVRIIKITLAVLYTFAALSLVARFREAPPSAGAAVRS